MKKIVYVVTGLELGWDCVCGVYEQYESAIKSLFDDEDISIEEMIEQYEDGRLDYIIHEKYLQN